VASPTNSWNGSNYVYYLTTLPASGVSVTNAVLNGSITVGPETTVVWFDWGADTNYGNIAGAITEPGNNECTNISATLNGLPGNVYHYRIDAANGSGVVYGDDQSFTVGFAPAATTLPAVNTTNGLALNAVVNPEGWDTTVYFQWGTPPFTSTTPGVDIGAGATSVNVSSLVTDLPQVTPYYYQVAASNVLGTVFGRVLFAGVPGVGLNNLYSFTGGNDGAGPVGGLVLGSDGCLYGATASGGTNGYGTVFKISTNGVLNSLYSFTGNYGDVSPEAGLVQGSDGYLYGTTSGNWNFYDYNGTLPLGTVYKISTKGAYTNLYSFVNQADYGGYSYGPPTSGAYPFAALVQGSNGTFYGTTASAIDVTGGELGEPATYNYGYGTVFPYTTHHGAGYLYGFGPLNTNDGA
jgi:uncharacterized repeat protein (TIGR03803 family)